MGQKNSVTVLFVCLGNICRSPSAQGVFQQIIVREGLTDRLRTDSVGTGAWHIDEPPDRRAQDAARHRGIDLSGLRGRQLSQQDFVDADYILAMDRDNLRTLLAACPQSYRYKVELLLSYATNTTQAEVPDPYYGGDGGFDAVLDMIEDASVGLLADIRKRYEL